MIVDTFEQLRAAPVSIFSPPFLLAFLLEADLHVTAYPPTTRGADLTLAELVSISFSSDGPSCS